MTNPDMTLQRALRTDAIHGSKGCGKGSEAAFSRKGIPKAIATADGITAGCGADRAGGMTAWSAIRGRRAATPAAKRTVPGLWSRAATKERQWPAALTRMPRTRANGLGRYADRARRQRSLQKRPDRVRCAAHGLQQVSRQVEPTSSCFVRRPRTLQGSTREQSTNAARCPSRSWRRARSAAGKPQWSAISCATA